MNRGFALSKWAKYRAARACENSKDMTGRPLIPGASSPPPPPPPLRGRVGVHSVRNV